MTPPLTPVIDPCTDSSLVPKPSSTFTTLTNTRKPYTSSVTNSRARTLPAPQPTPSQRLTTCATPLSQATQPASLFADAPHPDHHRHHTLHPSLTTLCPPNRTFRQFSRHW